MVFCASIASRVSCNDPCHTLHTIATMHCPTPYSITIAHSTRSMHRSDALDLLPACLYRQGQSNLAVRTIYSSALLDSCPFRYSNSRLSYLHIQDSCPFGISPLGKFQKDTCPRHLYHTSWYDNPFYIQYILL